MSMFFDKYSPVGPFTGLAAARNVYQGRIILSLMVFLYRLRKSSGGGAKPFRISGCRYG
jgi:hypothetical protein